MISAGVVDYDVAEQLQDALRTGILERGESDCLVLLEHPPTYTLGRNATRADVIADANWLSARDITVAECDRGGQVTYHGPGQLVGYPIINLDPDRRDIRRYVKDLQEVLIRTLADFELEGHGGEGREQIGVWVGQSKVASIGVHLKRWVTTHGFALNVDTDLSHFGGIVACGLPDVQMTSLAELLGEAPPIPYVAERCASHFAEVFERRIEAMTLGTLGGGTSDKHRAGSGSGAVLA